MPFIGTPLDTRNTFQSLQGKRFNGDGSTTDFTLDVAPGSTLDIEVFVGNVRQDPNSAYTVSGTTLSFTGAPPSGTNNIYVVHQAKSVGTIDVPTGGVAAGSLASSVLTGQTDVGGAIADADLFLIDDGAGGTLRKTAASRIKTYTALAGIDDQSSSNDDQITITDTAVVINEDSDDLDFRVESNGETDAIFVDGIDNTVQFFHNLDITGGDDPNGFSNDDIGMIVQGNNGQVVINTDAQALNVNRQNSDGSVIGIRQEGQGEGDISVSGSTVSYNSFCGAHWSRLADNSKPTILRGTVMESIATMMNWYNLDIKDENNKVVQKKSIGLPNGKSVGDAHTIVNNGITYTGTISREDNEQLPMCKISDTENSKAVYGVFMRWDDQDDGLDGDVNDMNVAALGAFVVRIHKDETVAIGDYLQSKGDGTAKKQADDILRASTIAKVTSTEKTHEYADGSYCVPCTLHCG